MIPTARYSEPAAGQVGDQPLCRAGGGGADLQRLVQEPQEHDSQQGRDRQLEAAVALHAQLEDRERDHARDHAGEQQRDAEQQVQSERRTEELGDVGGHRDDLGLHPHPPRQRAGIVVADALGKVGVGDDPELRRQVLDQHRHRVGEHHDPQQQEAELGATLEVGGEVARIHIGDRGDERRAEHRQGGAKVAFGEQLLESTGYGDPGLAERHPGAVGDGALERGTELARGRRRHADCTSTSMRIALASSPPSASS